MLSFCLLSPSENPSLSLNPSRRNLDQLNHEIYSSFLVITIFSINLPKPNRIDEIRGENPKKLEHQMRCIQRMMARSMMNKVKWIERLPSLAKRRRRHKRRGLFLRETKSMWNLGFVLWGGWVNNMKRDRKQISREAKIVSSTDEGGFFFQGHRPPIQTRLYHSVYNLFDLNLNIHYSGCLLECYKLNKGGCRILSFLNGMEVFYEQMLAFISNVNRLKACYNKHFAIVHPEQLVVEQLTHEQVFGQLEPKPTLVAETLRSGASMNKSGSNFADSKNLKLVVARKMNHMQCFLVLYYFFFICIQLVVHWIKHDFGSRIILVLPVFAYAAILKRNELIKSHHVWWTRWICGCKIENATDSHEYEAVIKLPKEPWICRNTEYLLEYLLGGVISTDKTRLDVDIMYAGVCAYYVHNLYYCPRICYLCKLNRKANRQHGHLSIRWIWRAYFTISKMGT